MFLEIRRIVNAFSTRCFHCFFDTFIFDISYYSSFRTISSATLILQTPVTKKFAHLLNYKIHTYYVVLFHKLSSKYQSTF